MATELKRRHCLFAADLVLIWPHFLTQCTDPFSVSSSLFFVALSTPAFAQQTEQTLPDYLGPRFHRRIPRQPPLRRFLPSVNQPAELVHHWNSIAIDATGLDHTPVAPESRASSASSSGRPGQPRHGDHSHRDVRRVNAIVGGYQSYTRLPVGETGASMTPRSRRPRTTPWRRCIPRRTRPSTPARRRAEPDPRRHAKSERRRPGTARGGRDPRAARRRRLANSRAAASASISSRAMTRANGARIRSARSRSRWALTGARCEPFVLQSASQFRVPPPPAMTSAPTPPPTMKSSVSAATA